MGGGGGSWAYLDLIRNAHCDWGHRLIICSDDPPRASSALKIKALPASVYLCMCVCVCDRVSTVACS